MKSNNIITHFNGRFQVAFKDGARGNTAMIAKDCSGVRSERGKIIFSHIDGTEMSFPTHEIDRIGINVYPKS